MFQRAARRYLILTPALLTTIAYVDPGNFGTNIAAGSQHAYTLVWVVVAASIAAALVQYLSAKLGLVTGKDLAENCADRLSRGWRIAAWLQAELIVVMTDLAEIVGGALGLYLLTGLPLTFGALVIGVFSFLVLAFGGSRGEVFRPLALALLLFVAVGVLGALVPLGPDVGAALAGVRPGPLDDGTLLIAVGIVGATVMPHALYFHSTLSRGETGRPARWRRRTLVLAIGGAMTLAGLVNVAILMLGASLPGQDGIEGLFAGLGAAGHTPSQVLLGLALLSSGLASSLVGTWTGQAVMSGYLRTTIAPWKRRAVAIVPPVAALALGIDAGTALFLSQVVLSFGLPVTLGSVVWLTGRRSVMGERRNGRLLAAAAWTVTGVITLMDVAVIALLFR